MKISAYIPSGSTRLSESSQRGSGIYMWADSCWLLSDRPLYIPDFAEEFVAIPALAVKAARLGKAIPARFSLRYIGDRTAALIILPKAEEPAFRAGAVIDQAMLSFDNAIVFGNWEKTRDIPSPLPPEKDTAATAAAILPSELDVCLEHSCPLSDGCNPREAVSSRVTLPGGDWVETISVISRTNTVKTGDIFLFPSPLSIPLSPGDTIRIFLPGPSDTPLLSTKFK